MAMFGSSWLEDSEDDGAMVPSSWKEENLEDDGPMVPSSWKDLTLREDLIVSAESLNKLELLTKLRRKTGMGLLNCKACLEDNNWNLKQAYENHRAYMWDGKLKNK